MLVKQTPPLLPLRTAKRQGVEEGSGMTAELLGNGWGDLPLLPALTDELTDQGAFVLAGFGQQLIEAVLGGGIQPDCERHDQKEPILYDE
jgi:hypothetical protein